MRVGRGGGNVYERAQEAANSSSPSLLSKLDPSPDLAPGLDALSAQTMLRIKALGYSAFFLVRPNPLAVGTIGRCLQVASVPALLNLRGLLEAGPAFGGNGWEGAISHLDLERDPSSWACSLVAAGFRSAQILRIPVAAGHCYEFVCLSMSGFISDASRHAAAVSIWSDWPRWRIAVQREVCPLSVRERAALAAASAGLTGSPAAESMGCVERTFRLHIENAKKKLFAANTPEAAFKAHLLCAL